jgi:hypothetical protein
MPADIPQGEHRVVIVIDVPEQNASQPQSEPVKAEKLWSPPGFKVFNFGSADPNQTFRREDLYPCRVQLVALLGKA